MKRSLLDTDILSFFMRGEEKVVKKVVRYLKGYGRLDTTIISYYEILKGLKLLNRPLKIREYRRLTKNFNIHGIDIEDAELAADIYADLRRKKKLIGDADIIIAGIAKAKGMVLVTNNIEHFSRVEGLEIENWLRD